MGMLDTIRKGLAETIGGEKASEAQQQKPATDPYGNPIYYDNMGNPLQMNQFGQMMPVVYSSVPFNQPVVNMPTQDAEVTNYGMKSIWFGIAALMFPLIGLIPAIFGLIYAAKAFSTPKGGKVAASVGAIICMVGMIVPLITIVFLLILYILWSKMQAMWEPDVVMPEEPKNVVESEYNEEETYWEYEYVNPVDDGYINDLGDFY